jgi:hypothetical protein
MTMNKTVKSDYTFAIQSSQMPEKQGLARIMLRGRMVITRRSAVLENEKPVPIFSNRHRAPSLGEIDGGRTLRGLAVITGCIVFWLVVAGLCEKFL